MVIIREKIKNMIQYSLKNKKYIIFSIIIIIIIWQIVAIIFNNRLLLPSFIDVAIELISKIKAINFYKLISSSILRCLQSLLISLLISIILSIISYFNKFIYNFIFPILAIIKAVPTMAFIVLLLIWTSKEYAPIIIGVLISLPIFYDLILNSLLSVDKEILRMCKVYRISNFDKIKSIVIPTILIEISKSISATLSLIFKVVISGELYSQPKYGIGTMIQLDKMQLNTVAVIAWIIIITLIVYTFDFIIENLMRSICMIKGSHKWR